MSRYNAPVLELHVGEKALVPADQLPRVQGLWQAYFGTSLKNTISSRARRFFGLGSRGSG